MNSLYSISEFAEAHRLSRTTVYRLLASGDLKARKVGRRTVITADDAAEWLRRLNNYHPASRRDDVAESTR